VIYSGLLVWHVLEILSASRILHPVEPALALRGSIGHVVGSQPGGDSSKASLKPKMHFSQAAIGSVQSALEKFAGILNVVVGVILSGGESRVTGCS
jgi:hypothetical protein